MTHMFALEKGKGGPAMVGIALCGFSIGLWKDKKVSFAIKSEMAEM
jgi:hypothetical protein